MPIQTYIETETAVISHIGTGKFAVDEVLQAVKSQFEHSDFVEGMAALWDFRASDMTGAGLADFRQIAEQSREQRAAHRISRMAFLVRTDFEAKLAELYGNIESSAGNQNRPMRIFKNRQDAIAWLTETD